MSQASGGAGRQAIGKELLILLGQEKAGAPALRDMPGLPRGRYATGASLQGPFRKLRAHTKLAVRRSSHEARTTPSAGVRCGASSMSRSVPENGTGSCSDRKR